MGMIKNTQKCDQVRRDEWGLVEKEGRLPDPSCLAFSIVHTDREPGRGYVQKGSLSL